MRPTLREETPTMLFKQRFLDGIRTGQITLAFRRWRRPSVTTGGTLLTPAGQLAIEAVELTLDAAVTAEEALAAGFASLDELRADLRTQRFGQLYRIRFSLAGPDPRLAVRENVLLTEAEAQALQTQLERLDKSSPLGAWTRAVLDLIARHPEQSAGELAELSGRDKEWLKLNIRKLRNLGLTESLNPGYRLSPRGKAFLEQMPAPLVDR